jgi:hypothetical protein
VPGERANDREAHTSIKGTGGKSGGCAWKAVELTSGGLLHVTETRLRVERFTRTVRQKSPVGIALRPVRKAQTVRVNSRTWNSWVVLRQPIGIGRAFQVQKTVKPKRKPAEWRSPCGERCLEPHGPYGLNLLNRRMRTRMYGGAAGRAIARSSYADWLASKRGQKKKARM